MPGRLCEHVVIDKLPFTPPNSPVEEALAEWLNTHGRDAFAEISVPRAAMKLAQWAGRGVRTVTDRAAITACDTRLVTTGYGKKIMAGLPPLPVIQSVHGKADAIKLLPDEPKSRRARTVSLCAEKMNASPK